MCRMEDKNRFYMYIRKKEKKKEKKEKKKEKLNVTTRTYMDEAMIE